MVESNNGQFLAGIVTRMNRIRDLAKDLSRELMRPGHSAQMTRIIAAAIKADTDAVWLALNRKNR